MTEVYYHSKAAQHVNAEVYCASLIELGISLQEIETFFESSFKRRYGKDIVSVEEAIDKSDNSNFTIRLNRDSLYDILPEGLIHQTAGRSRTGSMKAMVGEHKRFKKEENDARKFFAPIDKEIFSYGVFAELEERRCLKNIEHGMLTEEQYTFWNLSADLPKKAVATMLKLMPHLRQIKGNKQLTTQALSEILGKKITLKDGWENLKFKTQNEIGLGEARLGVVNTQYNQYDSYMMWTFEINNIHDDEVWQFNENKPYGKLLERFRQFYIPIDIEVTFNCVAPNLKRKLGCLRLGQGWNL